MSVSALALRAPFTNTAAANDGAKTEIIPFPNPLSQAEKNEIIRLKQFAIQMAAYEAAKANTPSDISGVTPAQHQKRPYRVSSTRRRQTSKQTDQNNLFSSAFAHIPKF